MDETILKIKDNGKYFFFRDYSKKNLNSQTAFNLCVLFKYLGFTLQNLLPHSILFLNFRPDVVFNRSSGTLFAPWPVFACF